jgi:transglutaminase-like putative cysteine protease
LAPRTAIGQTVERFSLAIDPQPAYTCERDDFFGNRVHYFAIHTPHKKLRVAAESVVTVNRVPVDVGVASPAWEKLAGELRAAADATRLHAFQLSLPSRRVSLGDLFRKYAAPSFAPGAPIAAATRHLVGRIHDDFKFDGQATHVNTSPEEFLKIGRGVCQDFAHLAIACLRSLGLAARYVSGYLRTEPPPGQPRLSGADASHAWLSVWCGELGWVDFDPTNDMVIGSDHITVAWGRDYDDVCPINGVFLGGGHHSVAVEVDVVPQHEQQQTQQQQ